MKNIRNIVLLGHLQSGKTTLAETLYAAATGNAKGSVDAGTSISDYTPEEKSRKSSVHSAILPLEYKGTKINLIDCPGSDDFITDTISAISVVKGAVLLIDASKGVEVGTVKHWNFLRKKNIPTIIYVNKMDKPDVHFDKLMDDIRTKLGKNAIPFCYPMGHNDGFDGFVNCVTLTARKFNGKECEDAEIYPDKRAAVLELHNQMVEAVAETSEELMEKFFMGEQLTREEIQEGLRKSVLGSELIPVLVGSAIKGIGIHTLLDMMIDYLPNPQDLNPIEGEDMDGNPVERKTLDEEPFSAFVFKTMVDPYFGTANIFKVNSGKIKVGDTIHVSKLDKDIQVSQLNTVTGSKMTPVNELTAGDIGCIVKADGVENSMTLSSPSSKITYPEIDYPTAVYYKALLTSSKSDEEKLGNVLAKICLEDKSIEVKRNPETNQLLIGTLGISHLSYLLERMKNTYKLNLTTEDSKIVYRETIRGAATGNGRYIKQSGGSGFYGVVEMEFKPAPENTFSEEVFGGAVPKNYFPAVEKGFYEACEKGLLAGFPVIGVHAILKDGKYHAVDSNELAFKMAAILAFKDAYMNCKPVILEPIIKITVTVEADMVGDIISDLNQRRAKVTGMDVNSRGNQKITALVPESEIQEYTNDLKSLTQGSGFFVREFSNYEAMPQALQDKLLKTLAEQK
ncbi:translation elongation factor 2 (EF-2/EF-G) [Anaeroplasma bactoclasticum]|jgi:elongation factor G|uniref:Translation elongation factor 2 (EF-2/EF-G) n=1 Tax=Anaeroplasma bactoclasticum TaxID=2088 RepID=A0A397RWZ7_9MOLU|nr:elongation factor G [Anaeroplasma bactoclasticum]RIA77772.1 translation elongation factor 2 (EF-2/EF-G) [Anaeroplasma bactoclasticum]